MTDYVTVNRSNWDDRVPHHVNAHDFDGFTTNPSHLSPVVQFDRPRLGSIAGLDVVHLQCHIGTDTLSLFRLGGGPTSPPRRWCPWLSTTICFATS